VTYPKENLMEPTHAIEKLIKSKEDHIHLWRFLSGAVFALKKYDHLAATWPKSNEPDETYKEEALKALASIQANTEPPGPWLRGFFYNAAVMRLDAAWERSIRVILAYSRQWDGAPRLYGRLRKIDPDLPKYDKSRFKLVRDEVNALKHAKHGASEQDREKPEILHGALEDLLVLLHRKFLVSATQI
jgi:hypothetical protein